MNAVTRKLDVGSSNPRIQCAVCGKWMRLHGIDENGIAFQRFYGSYETMDGAHHEHDGDVCVSCEQKIPNTKRYPHPMVKL